MSIASSSTVGVAGTWVIVLVFLRGGILFWALLLIQFGRIIDRGKQTCDGMGFRYTPTSARSGLTSARVPYFVDSNRTELDNHPARR